MRANRSCRLTAPTKFVVTQGVLKESALPRSRFGWGLSWRCGHVGRSSTQDGTIKLGGGAPASILPIRCGPLTVRSLSSKSPPLPGLVRRPDGWMRRCNTHRVWPLDHFAQARSAVDCVRAERALELGQFRAYQVIFDQITAVAEKACDRSLTMATQAAVSRSNQRHAQSLVPADKEVAMVAELAD